ARRGAGTGASHSPPKGTWTSSRYSSGARRQSARIARSTSSISRSGTGSGRTAGGAVISERAWAGEAGVTCMGVPLVCGEPPPPFYPGERRKQVTRPRLPAPGRTGRAGDVSPPVIGCHRGTHVPRSPRTPESRPVALGRHAGRHGRAVGGITGCRRAQTTGRG